MTVLGKKDGVMLMDVDNRFTEVRTENGMCQVMIRDGRVVLGNIQS